MCAKYRMLTYDEKRKMTMEEFEEKSMEEDEKGQEQEQKQQKENTIDSLDEIRMKKGKLVEQKQKQEESERKRISSISSNSSLTTTISSSAFSSSSYYVLDGEMKEMPGKRPRTRSNAGISDPQRLALMQSIVPAPIPVPATTLPLKPLSNKSTPISRRSRTRTIGRGWTLCSTVLDPENTIQQNHDRNDQKDEGDYDEESESDQEEESDRVSSIGSNSGSEVNTLLERVLSDIIHDRPENLFKVLQSQRRSIKIDSNPFYDDSDEKEKDDDDVVQEEIEDEYEEEEEKMKEIPRVNQKNGYGIDEESSEEGDQTAMTIEEINPTDWRKGILNLQLVGSPAEASEISKGKERSIDGENSSNDDNDNNSIDTGGTESDDELELEPERGIGIEKMTISRDTILGPISTAASPQIPIEWSQVCTGVSAQNRITFDDECETIKKRRNLILDDEDENKSFDSHQTGKTESSATIDIIMKPRSHLLRNRNGTMILEVDSDEAKDFLRTRNMSEIRNSFFSSTSNLSTLHRSSPSSISFSSHSGDNSLVEDIEYRSSDSPVQILNRKSPVQDKSVPVQWYKEKEIKSQIDQSVEAKISTMNTSTQTPTIRQSTNYHLPPLQRALLRSSCSRFWSPSSRTSLRTLAEQVPRIVFTSDEISQVEENESTNNEDQEDSSDDDEEKDEQEDSMPSEEEEDEGIPPKPTINHHIESDKVTRYIAKHNYRVTIYPRQKDPFVDPNLQNQIQRHLFAIFMGKTLQNNLQIPRLSSGKSGGGLNQSSSFRFSKRLSTTSISLPPPPQRPLPAVPVDVSINSVIEGDNTMTSCDGNSSAICTCTIEPDLKRRSRLSIISTNSTQHHHNHQLQKHRRRKTYVMGRHPLRDSWMTETESMTSYCSWISITSADTSISSSSSCCAQECLMHHSRRKQKKQRKSPISEIDGKSKSLTIPIPNNVLQIKDHPPPPSSTLMPEGWTRQDNHTRGTLLPKFQSLSPFFIDPNQLWPNLEKEKKRNSGTNVFKSQRISMININRLSIDSLTLSEIRLSSDTSINTIDNDEFEQQLESPSSINSIVMTPPRAEFLHSGLESPGKRISQILSPMMVKNPFPPFHPHSQPRQEHIPSLREPNTLPTSQYAPKHKRWILVDSNGNRITGGDVRDSGSTWHSQTNDNKVGEEGMEMSIESSFSSYSTMSLTNSSSSSSSEWSNGNSLDENVIIENVDRMSSMIMPTLTQSPGPILSLNGGGVESIPNSITSPTTRKSICFSPSSSASQRAIHLEKHQVRSILQRKSIETETSHNPRTSSRSSAAETRSSGGMSVHFSKLDPKLDAQPLSKSQLNAQKKQYLFSPPLPPPIPIHFQQTEQMQKKVDVPTMPQKKLNLPPTLPTIIAENVSPLSMPKQVQPQPVHLKQHSKPGHHTAPQPKKSKLTTQDLSFRIQREEVRKKRNDERLEALDKLEGKNKRSNLLANLIKSSTNASTPDSMPIGWNVGGTGQETSLTKAIEKARKKEFAAATAAGGLDNEGNQILILPTDNEQEESIATTPLTPTREELRKMEREWEIRHHVAEFAPKEAQKFTNVIGFDIGIVPFKKPPPLNEEGVENVRRSIRLMKFPPLRKNSTATTNIESADQVLPAYSHNDPHFANVNQTNLSSLSEQIKSDHHPIKKPPKGQFDPRLQQDLQTGLRKLSTAVDARQVAKERCVDK